MDHIGMDRDLGEVIEIGRFLIDDSNKSTGVACDMGA